MSKVLWTKDDDKILGALYKLKTPIDQIQIYIPHQPLKVIEARVKALDEGVEPAAIKTKAGKSRTSRSNTKPTFQRWTPEEDRILKQAVTEIGVGRWGDVSKLYFSPESATLGMAPENASTATQGSTNQERSPRACQIRWNFLNPQSAFLQGAWSADEIELFQELVSPDGVNDWEEISRAIGTRSPLQCHSQFKTVMHSGKKGKWTMEEIRLLQEAVQLYNRDWQKVAAHVGTRAPGQVRQKANNMSEDVVRRLKTRTQQTTDEP
ncbi:hypothetical protein BGW38_008887 [Lunasporangiospora selenospora]|uniref:Myb-like DNA-binding domain-containing protein n=1 Tax=Lunasporangiospora selenospora TaxID=979761 RepID=A0A9P6FZP4_9FUNG|nr:hypothetical protein BGW38_008887 [Lunasporangiospora selenospora]